MMELNAAPVIADDLGSLGLVGYGHFTSMYVTNGAVRGLDLHLDRLVRDCRVVFDAALDRDEVRRCVRHAIRDVAEPVVVRVTIYDPALTLGRPGDVGRPQILVTMRPAPSVPAAPIRLQTAMYSRDVPKVKHVGLFGAVYQRALAQRAGFDDVLFTSSDGSITEIATSNVAFITEAGELVWPRAEVLAGTTARLLTQVRDEEVRTERITIAQLDQYVGVIATNAATGVRAVIGIDETHWPEHELVTVLQKQYESIPPAEV